MFGEGFFAINLNINRQKTQLKLRLTWEFHRHLGCDW